MKPAYLVCFPLHSSTSASYSKSSAAFVLDSGSRDIGSGVVLTLEIQYDVELLSDGALVSEPPQDAAQKGVPNENQVQILEWERTISSKKGRFAPRS
jgi:hypothetical protein